MTATIDQDRAAAFADRVVEVLDDASLALHLCLGHRTGLLDAMDGLGPATSEEVARAAVLDERYVRELLGGLTVGEVVEYDPTDRTYVLPPEHAAFTTRAAGPDNLAFYTQYLSLMAAVEPEIVRVFREGGGVPYSEFDTFQQLQRDETARVYDAALVDDIVPLVDGLTDRLTEGISVLDVGCGGGHAVNLLGRAFPESRFTGVDISEEGIEIARAEAEAWGLDNVTFRVGDAAEVAGSWDLITAFDTVHDQAQPTKVLDAVASALAPGGTFLMGDIAVSSQLERNVGQPFAPLVFAFSVFHCMTVSLAYGGEALGTAWGIERAEEMLAAAGFTDVTTEQVEGDPLNVYFIARAS